MKIKGMEFIFYCTKCKGVIKDCNSDKLPDGKFQCNCSIGFTTEKKGHKYNGVRFNKQ